jgi:Lrp/AsnC family transcriptional regulator, regulator for asnA, asnC and gidA
MEANYEFDNVDLKILSILQQDASIPYTEIGKQVFVSPGTVHVRMKKMEQADVVKGTKLQIDYTKLGYDIIAFLGIYLERGDLYDSVISRLKEIPEIITAHYTTGNYGIFVQIVCRDTKHLHQVLHNKIQKVEGIQRTETFISLQESINRPLIV